MAGEQPRRSVFDRRRGHIQFTGLLTDPTDTERPKPSPSSSGLNGHEVHGSRFVGVVNEASATQPRVVGDDEAD